MFFCCDCCVLSGRGLCDGLITRPEESYRLWRVVVCYQETLKTRRLKPATGLWKIQPQWVVTPGKQQQTTYISVDIYRSFATRVSQLKIWHFWVIGIERTVCRFTFNRCSVITQFVKLAAGEQLCCLCAHRNLRRFKTFKFSPG